VADEDLLIRVGLTEKQYLAAIKRLEAQSVRAANGVDKAFAKQNRNFVRGAQQANKAAGGFANGGLRQIGMQLSQVAQQGAATGDYFKAMSIQAADIGLAFGGIGIAVGAALTVLGPFVADLIAGGDAAEDVETKIKALSDAMSRLDAARSASGQGRSSLVDDYGAMADRARDLIKIEREIAEIRAREAQQAATRAVGQGLGLGGVIGLDPDEVRFAEVTMKALRMEIDRLQQSGRDLSDEGFRKVNQQIVELQERAESLRSVSRNFDDLADILGITEREAREVAARFAEIEQTDGTRARADAMIALASYINDVSDNLGDADEDGQALYDSLLDAVRAALNLSAVDVASSIADGADEAGRMLSNLQAAAAQFNAISRRESKVYSGRGGDPRDFMDGGSQSGDNYRASMDYTPIDEIIARYTPSARKGRSGGGGGGSSAADKQQTEWAREAARYIEQTRTALEEYNAELQLLETLNAKGFFSEAPEAYARAVQQVNEEFQRAQFEDLIAGIDSVSDAMANAIVNGEDLGESMRQILRQMVADIVSSGIRQLLMSAFGLGGLGGGGGGLLGALFGGFRAAGGPVAAGKAYMVGERGPEIMVPGASGQIIPNNALGGGVNMKTEIINNTSAQIVEESETRADGTRLQRFILSEAVAEGATVRGGAGRRALGAMGVRQRKTLR
jgi:FtsZ-binding cell division protein ZapB